MTLADYCRWANMGYRDGQPGTEVDVAERVKKLERDCLSYSRSVSNLHVIIDRMRAE